MNCVSEKPPEAEGSRQVRVSLTIVKLVPQKLVPESKVASPGLEEIIRIMTNGGKGC
jgi:hypothetical protein